MTVETEIGKITASKEVLNKISLVFGRSAYEHKRKGHGSIAEQHRKISHEIYVALDKANYFTE